jgi:hypothetical protein
VQIDKFLCDHPIGLLAAFEAKFNLDTIAEELLNSFINNSMFAKPRKPQNP